MHRLIGCYWVIVHAVGFVLVELTAERGMTWNATHYACHLIPLPLCGLFETAMGNLTSSGSQSAAM